MLNKNTPGIKKVRGQSEAALQIGTYVRPKTLISVEVKKLLIKNYLNDIQYRIRQNVRGGKLSRFSRILAKREYFTIETFPALQLENNYCSQ